MDYFEVWQRLCARLSLHRVIESYQELISHYSESNRHYHTLGHIGHCIHEWRRVRKRLTKPNQALFALFFHDVIYSTKEDPTLNEVRSAEVARKTIMLMGARSEDADLIDRLILATDHRRFPLETNDERFVADIDLSGLAFRWPIFLRDNLNVRREYGDVSDFDFYFHNAKFLEAILRRPKIYQTQYYFQRLEDSARQNLTRHIKRVRSMGTGI